MLSRDAKSTLILSAALAAGALTSDFPAGAQSTTVECQGLCARLANLFVRADVGPSGAWVLGTTGGDPKTPDDDDQRLIYGFEPAGRSQVGTGYVTLRAEAGGQTADLTWSGPSPQSTSDGEVVNTWRWTAPFDLVVTQTLRLQPNRFSGREDLLVARWDVENRGAVPVGLGLRALVDVKLANEDGAPYFIPSLGTVTDETDFRGSAVPDYWIAFASDRFDTRLLRGIGVLSEEGIERPDRFVIGVWSRLQSTRWDFDIKPFQPVTGDSAVAMYWDPRPVPPGGRITRRTGYGLYGGGGGSAFVSMPLEARCGDEFQAAAFFSNFSDVTLAGGQATVTLPGSLELAPGETARKPLADIPIAETGSVSWRVRVRPGARGVESLSVEAVFAGGERLQGASQIDISCPPTPSPTVAPSTPRPSPSSTRPVSPSPTPPPTSEPGQACESIRGRVPPAAISDALANPDRVRGYQELSNPGLPPGPGNPRKVWLSLQDLGKAYHPIFNALVYKVGCP